ncbi:MAG: helix-turn-helix transcriptional regulator [Chitinophagales bacterium]|jgi:DNA-binding transcriptional ArsR family regulator|nr:helix-turn-helix transcriptional regulator [Chitinophagales bacterium]
MPKIAAPELTLVSKNGSSKISIRIDYAALKKAAGVLRAVNHKLRQSIIRLLEDNVKMTVTEIYVKLRLEQSVASQHLAILRNANVVKTDRDGKFIYYTLNHNRISELADLVEELAN